MFDNPKRDLQRLQEELLAAEEPEWEPEADEEDPEEAFRDMKQMLAREDWEETDREPLYRSYQEDADEMNFEEAPEEPDFEETPLPKEKKKGMGGLIAAVILESLALLAIAAWMLWG